MMEILLPLSTSIQTGSTLPVTVAEIKKVRVKETAK